MWVGNKYYWHSSNNVDINRFNEDLKKKFGGAPATLHYFSLEDTYYNFFVEDLFTKWLSSVNLTEAPDSFLPILDKLNSIICGDRNSLKALHTILNDLSDYLSPLGICLIKYQIAIPSSRLRTASLDDLLAEICKTYGVETSLELSALKESLITREFLRCSILKLHRQIGDELDPGVDALSSFSLADSKTILPCVEPLYDILTAALYTRDSEEDYKLIRELAHFFP